MDNINFAIIERFRSRHIFSKKKKKKQLKPPNATPKKPNRASKRWRKLVFEVNGLFSMDSFFYSSGRKRPVYCNLTPLIIKWIILKLVFKESSLQFYAVNIVHHTFKLHWSIYIYIYKSERKHAEMAKHGRSLETFGTCQKHQHSKKTHLENLTRKVITIPLSWFRFHNTNHVLKYKTQLRNKQPIKSFIPSLT